MSAPRRSAECPVCWYAHKLRADGTFGKHHIWEGHKYRGVCPGVGMSPGPHLVSQELFDAISALGARKPAAIGDEKKR